MRGASPPRAVARPARRGAFARPALRQVIDATRSRLGPAVSSGTTPRRSARRGFPTVETEFTWEVNRPASVTLSPVEKRWTLSWGAPALASPESEVLLRGVSSPQAKSLEGKLRHLERNVFRSWRMRLPLAEREGTRRMQQRHMWRLPASTGSPCVPEEISAGPTISGGCLRQLHCFWELASLHELKVVGDDSLDVAVTDSADPGYRSGEFFEVGLLGPIGETLFLVAPSSTSPWPTALYALHTCDLMSPKMGAPRPHTLIFTPFEKDKSTKTAFFDETILLDDDVLPEPSELMRLLAMALPERYKDKPSVMAVPLWDGSFRGLAEHLMGTEEMHRLSCKEKVCLAWRGGAKLDLRPNRGTADEARSRLRHLTGASLRTHSMRGRVLKPVNEPGRIEPDNVSLVRKHFASFVHDGVFLGPRRKQLAAERS